MVELNSNLRFCGPYERNPANVVAEPCRRVAESRIYQNQGFQPSINALREIFRNKKECLLHGNLHCGSILVKDGEAKVN